MADVLLHFQNTPDLRKFGMLGFHRLNGYNPSKAAFKRTHVTSTVLLNLEKLKGVEYRWRAHVWEDLQFNRDAEKQGAVLCKCYRFAFSSPQLREGGCAALVARGEALDLDGRSEPSLQPIQQHGAAEIADHPGELAITVNSSEEDVGRYIRSRGDLFGEKNAGEYAKAMVQQNMDGEILLGEDFLAAIKNDEPLVRHLGMTVGHKFRLMSLLKELKNESGNAAPA